MQWIEDHSDILAHAYSIRKILDDHPELLGASKTIASYARTAEQMCASPSLLAYIQEQADSIAYLPMADYRAAREIGKQGHPRKRAAKKAFKKTHVEFSDLQISIFLLLADKAIDRLIDLDAGKLAIVSSFLLVLIYVACHTKSDQDDAMSDSDMFTCEQIGAGYDGEKRKH